MSAPVLLAVSVGSRWAPCVSYPAGSPGRHGYWAEDSRGGWGIATRSAPDAVAACARPVLLRSRRAAWERAALTAGIATDDAAGLLVVRP